MRTFTVILLVVDEVFVVAAGVCGGFLLQKKRDPRQGVAKLPDKKASLAESLTMVVVEETRERRKFVW